MFCPNNTLCLKGFQCISGFCIYFMGSHLDQDNNKSLVLPMIGAILHDLPSLRNLYFGIFIILILIGLINNIFSLMTFIRDRIRYTISGVYLIVYTVFSLILMILILTNLITFFYYENYFFRLWACHGYPYFSLIMVYTSISISTIIAVEGVLTKRFNYEKFRPRQLPIIISICVLIIVSITNLDKIFLRRLITTQSGQFSCIIDQSYYGYSSNICFYTYIILSCLIHFICLIYILSIKTKESLCQKFFFYQNQTVPSLFILLCLILSGIYRYYSYFYLTNLSTYKIRSYIGFMFVFYAPQIFTYMIYVYPNDFYVKEFYQIWFYRKLCCCFYNRRRHIQEFEVIHKLWQRRTSLETAKTITSLDDTCIESEFYQKNKI